MRLDTSQPNIHCSGSVLVVSRGTIMFEVSGHDGPVHDDHRELTARRAVVPIHIS